jgi:hypothetical protein
MSTMKEEWLIPKRVMTRPDDRGKFDELFVYDDAGNCILHAEMMSDKTLWIGIYPPDTGDVRAVMWISSKGKLKISAHED